MNTKPTQKLRLAAGALIGFAVAASVARAAAPPAEIVVTGEKIFPESMTSAPDGSVIFGSVGQRAIYRAKPGSANADVWIQPGTDGISSIFGVFVDAKSNTLYACSGTPAFGPPAAGAPPPPPSALHAFDLKTGAPKGNYPLPTAGGFCNDIAVDAAGNAYASDTSNMEVVRLKKGATGLEVWAGNGAFGPKGGILDGISVLGNRVLVNTLGTSKVWSVPIGADGKSGAVTEVTLDRAISRPDGMRSFGREKLLIVEGGNGGRLSKITLSGNNGKVETVKEGYPDGPVAVTVVGTTAYVVEGQLSAMMGRRPAAAGAPPAPPPEPKPFKATAVEVGKP
jgi:sugar lactone lactonase YvrE